MQEQVPAGWMPDRNDDDVPSPQKNWFDLNLESEFLLTKAGTPRERIEVAQVQREWHRLPRLRQTYDRLRRYFLPYHPDHQRRYSIWGPKDKHWITFTEGAKLEYPVPRKNSKQVIWKEKYPDRFSHPKHWLKLMLGQISLSSWWHRCEKAHCILVDLDFKPHWCSMTEEEKPLALAPWVAACEDVNVELDIQLRPQFYASGGKGVYLFIPVDHPYPRYALGLLLHEIITMAREEGAFFHDDPEFSPADSPRLEVHVDIANVPLVDSDHQSMTDIPSGLRLVWSRYRIEEKPDLPPVRSGWVDRQGRHVEDQVDFFLTMEDSTSLEKGLEGLERHWEGLGVLHGEVRRMWRESGSEGDYASFLLQTLHDGYERADPEKRSQSGSIDSVIKRLLGNGNGNVNGNVNGNGKDNGKAPDWRELHRWLYRQSGRLIGDIPRQPPLSIVSPPAGHDHQPPRLPSVGESSRPVSRDAWRHLLPDRIVQRDNYARALIDDGSQLKACSSALRARPNIVEMQQADDLIGEIAEEICCRGDLRAPDFVRSSVRSTIRKLLEGTLSMEVGEPFPLSSVQKECCAVISRDLCSPKPPKGLDKGKMGMIIENIARLINVREEVEIDQRSLAEWSGVSQPRISSALSLMRRDCAGCRVPLLELVRVGSKGRRAARYAVLRESWGTALLPPARA